MALCAGGATLLFLIAALARIIVTLLTVLPQSILWDTSFLTLRFDFWLLTFIAKRIVQLTQERLLSN